MADHSGPPNGEIILDQTEDGRTRVECRFEHETLWMSQALMAELFQTSAQNITLHLKSFYSEGEIDEQATCIERSVNFFEARRFAAPSAPSPAMRRRRNRLSPLFKTILVPATACNCLTTRFSPTPETSRSAME